MSRLLERGSIEVARDFSVDTNVGRLGLQWNTSNNAI